MLKELEHWDQWEENPVVVISDKPVNTIQTKIDEYRQQAFKSESTEERQLNFFEVIIFVILILLMRNRQKYIILYMCTIEYDTKDHHADKDFS